MHESLENSLAVSVPPHLHPFLEGSGKLGELIRNTVWNNATLGHPDRWPSAMRCSVSLCLNAPTPTCLFWGPEARLLYNDEWSLIPGSNHPATLGRPAHEIWQDHWPNRDAMIENVLASGMPARAENHLIPLNRNGFEEECYFTHLSSPVRSEDGQVQGVLQALLETTSQVLAERRAGALLALARGLSKAQSPAEIAAVSVEALGSLEQDVPCAAFYLAAADGTWLRQAAAGGRLSAEGREVFAPASLDADRASKGHKPQMPRWAIVGAQHAALPAGCCVFDWRPGTGSAPFASACSIPVAQVLLLPLWSTDRHLPPAGYLLLGLNPRLRMNAAYSAFLQGATVSMGTALRSSLVRVREQELAEVYRLALETGRFGTWSLDVEAGQMQCSPRAAALLGTGTQESWELPMALERYHPNDRNAVREALARALEQELELQYEARLQDADDGERWLWVRGAFHRDRAGHRRLSGLVGDISERKRAEGMLRETEKLAAAGRLAATIAHEINNPLEAVTNLIYLASLDEDLSPATLRLLGSADKELNRVTHIAQQTLGFYRDTRGPVDTDIQQIVIDLVSLFQRQPQSKGVVFDMSRVAQVQLRCLQGELRQVLSNLIANAMQASAADGRIRVSARTSLDLATGEPLLRLLVADYGSGIAPEDQGRLFTAFFTTKRDIGNGLGLWVSKGILEKQGGTIRFRSRTGTQSGTCFMITLPTKTSRGVPQ